MRFTKRWYNFFKFLLVVVASSVTAMVLPVSAEVHPETNCLEPVGDIETLTVMILDGATEDEIIEAFTRLNALSEDAVRAAYFAYSGAILEGGERTSMNVRLLVSEMSTCTRLVVI